MKKSNFHKKLFREDKFERKYSCPNRRLVLLRQDKHDEKKEWRKYMKQEQSLQEKEWDEKQWDDEPLPPDIEDDDTICQDVFQVFGQNYIDSASLALPVKKRRSTPIELMTVIDELDMELVEEKNRKMMEYIRNALTSENVNTFAKDILQGKMAVSISSVFENNPEMLTKIIGLYTYSQTPEREYEIKLTNKFVECNGVRFKEFIVEERKR